MYKNLDKALEKVTTYDVLTIGHGEEITLTDEYVLYKYAEDDIITVVFEEEWEEVAQVMIDKHEGELVLTFEMLVD